MLGPHAARGYTVTYDRLGTNVWVTDTAAGIARLEKTVPMRGSSGRGLRMVGALTAAIALIASGCGGDSKAEKSTSTAATSAPTTTAATSTTAASTEPTDSTTAGSSTTAGETTGGGSIEFTTADGRTTRFGGFEWTIDGITLGGADAADEPSVQVDLTAKNLTDGDLTMIEPPLMRFGADPVEVAGKITGTGGYPRATAGASARASYAFALPAGALANAAALKDAVLIFGSTKVLRAGIPLDGDAVKTPTVKPTPVNATLSIEGNSYGDLTVTSVMPALDAEKTIATAGDDEALDFRAAPDTIWLAFDVTLTCRGGASGQDCRFGLNEDMLRVEVDGAAEGFETADSSLFEITTAMSPGSTAQALPQLLVKRGSSYALLLGDPNDPASVKKVPLNIGPAVDSLYASVADFQTK